MQEKKIPAYLTLYRSLRTKIEAGDYSFGERLPSRRDLSAREGVSPITVIHAYEILADEGFVEPRERSGYFVAYRGTAAPEGEKTLSFPFLPPRGSLSENGGEIFPYPVIARTARAVFGKYGESLMRRSENIGEPILRRAIAEYLARSRGLSVSPDSILIGAGAESLYVSCIRLLGHDRIYGAEYPAYETIFRVYEMEGMDCRRLPLGNDGILSSALSATDAGVLHLTPCRSFPTGVTASASKRREYLNWLADGDRFLIEDDFESEFSSSGKPEDTLFSLDTRGRVIYINTFSKTLSPGIRLAYALLPDALMRRYREQFGFLACPVPTFEQILVAELLMRGDFERHIGRCRRARRTKN